MCHYFSCGFATSLSYPDFLRSQRRLYGAIENLGNYHFRFFIGDIAERNHVVLAFLPGIYILILTILHYSFSVSNSKLEISQN